MAEFNSSAGTARPAAPGPLLDRLHAYASAGSRYGNIAVHVEADLDFVPWLLIGRGREGWDWTQAGRGGDQDVVANLASPTSFVPKYLSAALIDQILAEAGVIDLDQIEVRLKRAANIAGTEFQTILWRFASGRSGWDWQFDQSPNLGLSSITVGASALGAGSSGAGNTRDTSVAGNNQSRVFTWAWGSHGNRKGFSYGGSIQGVNGNDPNSFLWENGTENHAIPYTEIYIRKL